MHWYHIKIVVYLQFGKAAQEELQAGAGTAATKDGEDCGCVVHAEAYDGSGE